MARGPLLEAVMLVCEMGGRRGALSANALELVMHRNFFPADQGTYPVP